RRRRNSTTNEPSRKSVRNGELMATVRKSVSPTKKVGTCQSRLQARCPRPIWPCATTPAAASLAFMAFPWPDGDRPNVPNDKREAFGKNGAGCQGEGARNLITWGEKGCIRKPAGKPGFVSAMGGDGHFSSRPVARAVQRPTRKS